jgi:hypothetical protein
MKNWMITIKYLCDICNGLPGSYKHVGQNKILIICKTCNGNKYIEKTISILELINIINSSQDGYNLLDLTNMINNMRDGY